MSSLCSKLFTIGAALAKTARGRRLAGRSAEFGTKNPGSFTWSITQDRERDIRFEPIPSGCRPEMLPLNTSCAILVDPQRLELWHHAKSGARLIREMKVQ
ncbi:MAG TPA: hypothetical protein VHU83_24310 [Bryobacteraceae bacterium]|nr:hypothetical protein [Bryobacteraceae bacterium]